eukprot:XP_001609827.1 protein phosphatase 1, regulatory (inhibitor) subunit 7 [Babesia bovis T2Bo]
MTDDADIRIQRIGVDLEAPSESSVIEFHCERIKRIENLERCTALKKLAIVSNLVEKIEKLDSNTALETLDLYQNNIKIIENIGHLHALRVLDVSFNQIEVIENLESLINLRELYLTNNKIATVENLCMLKQLELLELGSNRIREYGDIGALTALKSLWLGRNKITSMQVPPLPMLNKLSLQNNRIDTWDERLATGCPMLSELYLSFNGLKEVPAWINTMKMLKILDLGNNQISKINITEDNIYIEELWLSQPSASYTST